MNLSDYNKMLPVEALMSTAEEMHEAYVNASPFAHAVIDDMFDEGLLTEVVREFDGQTQTWREFESKYEKKKQLNRDEHLGPITRALFHNLNSEPFLEFLTKLTGIKGLIPDPYLVGGGLHRIGQGGKLGIHVDFNRHEQMRVFRRLNVIIYLNKDWKEEWGGHFEMWTEDKNACAKKILPVFNRMAIFNTTSKSFHGHPIPLTCPEDVYRKSLALYYYTAEDQGEQESDSHSTVFLDEHGKREELTGKKPNAFKQAIKTIIGKK